MSMKKITDLDLSSKRLLIRVDFNVPVKDGKITSDVRIKAALPTIEYAIKHGAKTILMSHLGRPTEGVLTEADSLAPVAKRLGELIGQPVPLVNDWLNGVNVDSGKVVMCENVRCNKGEKKNDDELAKKMANLCDIFCMDAFATAHRAEASTHGVAKFAKIACAGILLATELDALTKALEKPAHPLVAIVGGAKVSTKLLVLEALIDKVGQLIVGGGIANTFLAAAGYSVGKSLIEAELIEDAKRLLAKAKTKNVNLPLPTDVVVAKELSPTAKAEIKQVSQIADDDMILDIGPASTKTIVSIINDSKTIMWNGPVGVFEIDQFGAGTKTIAETIAKSSAFSLAGGGDTIAAIEKYGVEKNISYISTAGGAFLEFVEGKKLPAVAILEERAK